jgi:hypothetical protein
LPDSQSTAASATQPCFSFRHLLFRFLLHIVGFCLISLLRRLFIVLPLACCSIRCCFLVVPLPVRQDDVFCLILLVRRLLIILPLACFSIRHRLCCSAWHFSPPFSLLFRFTAPDFILFFCCADCSSF